MILAIDPGLATCGVALFDDDHRLVDADVFTSKPERKPRGHVGAWRSRDLGRRAHEMASWLRDWTDYLGGDVTDTAIVEGFGLGQQANHLIAMSVAAGVVRAILSEALPPDQIVYVSPNDWRDGIGWSEPKRPPRIKLPAKATKAQRGEAKQRERERAAHKRNADRGLYEFLSTMTDGNLVAGHVRGHGRRGSDVVHALDAFGIGWWWLTTQACKEAA